MGQVKLIIDGQEIEADSGTTILEAAGSADIYIPSLCSHPDLPPAEGIEAAKVVYQGDRKIENTMPEESGKGCGLCVVEVEGEGELVQSCQTEVKEGMVVITDNDRIREKRQENLVPILARHRHACLTCAQQEGCSRSQCSTNVPENERCCTQFGHCELQNVANYVGISLATPKWIPTDLPILDNHPLFVRDYNLCIGCTRCIRACRDLRGIEAIGFVYDEDGLVQVGTLGPTLEESGCKFCTACVEVCPTGALMDKSVRPGKKEEDIVPCKDACPAHIDIPGYLRLIGQGKRDEANAVIREKVPFPGILGRVCIHPCEEACRRGEVNDPVSICVLKRYAADGDKGLWKENTKTGDATGKKVAVVGAGPGGMTAAFYLRKQGHMVTVFESRSRAGGMMRYGIPDYRLPGKVLDQEIRDILALGIEFRPNQALGKDFTFDQLKNDGYEAVFLGVGAQLSRRIPLDGSDLPDVLWGVDFLGRIAEGEDIRLKDRVIVIGGGNVAVDVALSAMRCGAKEVTMACLETREEMPAHEWEVEGIRLMPSWGPHRIRSENGQVTGMELVRCTSVFDDKGNFNPTFDDTKETIEGDQVILAIGQASDLSFIGDDSGVSVDRGLIVVDQETLETGLKGVYAGGDVAAMPGAIIHAIAAGRKAASSIDKALGGTGDIEEVLCERDAPNQLIGRDEEFALWPREKVPELELEARSEGFQEVALGYTDEQAVKEARRCLQCDLRLYLGANPSPPEKILAFNAEHINEAPEEEGVYQLYDEERNIIAIKGTANLRESLLQELEDNERAAFFDVEEDKMFSQRESELIQQYLQEHGEMPGGGDDELDDLF
ncbi:MAG: FAD-dependent oxidoreductase [Deltaproteobacteria bacterium]|nr:FAD-dependent oxidoreductase [Deltaproteobacteria bacterium]